jgi:hypothetical protein
LAANLQRAKKLPALKTLLVQSGPPAQQSVKTHKVMLEMISALNGIPLQQRPRRKASGTPARPR